MTKVKKNINAEITEDTIHQEHPFLSMNICTLIKYAENMKAASDIKDAAWAAVLCNNSGIKVSSA
jgi:hypothetical protein